MKLLSLLIISILPVFLIGFYVNKKDKDKEPIKLLLKLFFCGVGSCFMVLIITSLLGLFIPFALSNPMELNLFELIFYAFIFVALLEEFCKWVFVYKVSYNDYNFDRIYDMIVYSVFVALGFACFENILYVLQNGFVVGIIRALLAVPGHACDGVFMGYFLGMSKYYSLYNNNSLKRKNMFLSIIVPTLLHGFYDYCLFSGSIILLVLFLIFVISLYVFSIMKIKEVSSIYRKMKYKENFCPICGRRIDSDYCPICGRKNN